jgi:carbohydrate-selective porin OprB
MKLNFLNFLSILLLSLVGFAQDADTSANDFVSKGFKAHAFLINTTDVVGVTNQNQPFVLGANGLQLTTFTKENGWWKGGMFSMFLLNTFGSNPTTNYVGDLQMFSNIESAPNDRLKLGSVDGIDYRTFLYTLYYQHFYKNFKILVGQYDLNFDFAFSNVGLNFMNSSFGVQPTITFNVPPFSTFPYTSLCARAEYTKGDYVFRGAIAQGSGGNEITNPHGAKYAQNFKNSGMFAIAEINRVKYNDYSLLSDYKVGAWMHTGGDSMHFEVQYQNTIDSALTVFSNHMNYGAYFIADKMLTVENGDSTQGLFGFVDLGWAPGNHNFFNFYAGGGLSYTGLFPKRDADILSLGIANPFVSKNLTNNGYAKTEKAIELNYNFVTEHFNIQPCVQYLVNIGANQGINQYAFMLRLTSHKGVFY